MKVRKSQASLALRLWVLCTVFVWPFIEGWELAGWAALGGALALAWKLLPDEPPAPVERLPYQHLYERPRDGE